MAMNETIKAARLSLGWSMEELARRIAEHEGSAKPLSWQTIQQWENGGTAPRHKRLESVAAVLGLSVPELVSGKTNPAVEMDLDHHPELEPVRVVKLRLQAGMTGFAVEPDETEAAPIFFRSDWLKQRGFKSYKLIALKVSGQSMESTLYQDDVVVANTADTEPKDGEVYAVNYEGEPLVKRLVRDEGQWWLQSDNQDKRRFPKKACRGESCIIVGRIVHRQSERI